MTLASEEPEHSTDGKITETILWSEVKAHVQHKISERLVICQEMAASGIRRSVSTRCIVLKC